jgi:flagellar biosynthetic protein FliQ
MNPEVAIDLFKTTIFFALYIVAPFLGVTLLVGLVASLIQSVTSLQEQTLAFVPKLFALAVVTVALGPWLLRSLTEFAIQTITKMSEMGR